MFYNFLSHAVASPQTIDRILSIEVFHASHIAALKVTYRLNNGAQMVVEYGTCISILRHSSSVINFVGQYMSVFPAMISHFSLENDVLVEVRGRFGEDAIYEIEFWIQNGILRKAGQLFCIR